jgi:DNA-binding IscR family transcriptional regulator
MKTYMLVLLNHLDSGEGWLSQVREIALAHGITKVYLARVTPTFTNPSIKYFP